MSATAQPSRRSLLALALSAPLAGTVLAACGDSGPAGSSGSAASIWILTGQPGEGIRTDSVNAFNKANPDSELALSSYQNDAFKAKVRTAIGADQGPTIIWTWGGGGLRDYVKNDQVEDLTSFFSENSALKDKLFSSAFGAATVDDKVYAVPCENVSPIVMFYDKRAFEKVGAQLPKTWDDVMALVPTFNAAGIAPFSLGGQSRWTNMMWLEFLYDRIGGAELFDSIYAGTPDAWSQPDSIAALKAVQDLVRANGFITGFASITADSNADQALLYTGKAAMMLHGAWTYGSMKSDGGDFVTGGHLAWSSFPTVTGGKGDPSNTVGNPSSYYALSAKATDEAKTAAKKYFADGLNTDATTKAWVDAGSVPIVNGSDSMFAGSEDEAWLQFVYDTASGAKNFQQSWDQALSPTQAETLLDNIAKLFGLAITPEEFATAMNATIAPA